MKVAEIQHGENVVLSVSFHLSSMFRHSWSNNATEETLSKSLQVLFCLYDSKRKTSMIDCIKRIGLRGMREERDKWQIIKSHNFREFSKSGKLHRHF